MAADLTLSLRTQKLEIEHGYRVWKTVNTSATWPAKRTALLLCDVWDAHTCRGAEERLEKLLPRMQQVVQALRARGVLIVHAPSDVIDFYQGTPARERVLSVPKVEPPPNITHDDPPQPIDSSDSCDTVPDVKHPEYKEGMPYPWKRQHAAIEIDQTQDVISANGRELYSYYRSRGIDRVIEMGVHTNMCILHRSFSIKQMVRWGIEIALVRDLTDAMYNPAKAPYVSHDDGTRLVVEYIEKFWCPTVSSAELLSKA
jgi:nicotinamidase-related amidase